MQLPDAVLFSIISRESQLILAIDSTKGINFGDLKTFRMIFSHIVVQNMQ